MKCYKNYIFDLYATLVDIHTDQTKPSLWEYMSMIYSRYGAIYSWEEMRSEYFRLVKENMELLKKELHTDDPEADIEHVFLRLYYEKTGKDISENGTDSSTWTRLICSVFRSLSMEWLRLYPNTLSALEKLKKQGSRVFLLSNAQAAFTRPELDILGLTGLFDDIFISSEHRIKKPEPVFLQKLMQKHGLSPEDTVYVGNEVFSDMLIADRCGIQGILLNTAGESDKAIKEEMEKAGLKNPDRITIVRSGDISSLINI